MNRSVTLASCLLVILAAVVRTAAADDTPADAPKQSKQHNECVFFSTVYDWRTLDDSNLIVWAPNKRDAYHVQLSMALPGLRFANALAFIDGNQDGMLCSYGRDAIASNDGGIPGKSSIRSMTRVDAAELAALGEKYKVNLNREKKKKPPAEPTREQSQ